MGKRMNWMMGALCVLALVVGGWAMQQRAGAQDGTPSVTGGPATPPPPATGEGAKPGAPQERGATSGGEGAREAAAAVEKPDVPVVVPGRPRAYVSIQYPGMRHGRFNEFSEGVAPGIVDLAFAMGFSGIGHWQPEGYEQLSALPLDRRYTTLADIFMVPTSLVCGVSPNFERAWWRARELGMDNLWYEGSASVINLGTPERPELRWVSLPDDAALITRRFETICARYAPEYLFVDDISKTGGWLSMPDDQQWADATGDVVIRSGMAGPKRTKGGLTTLTRAVAAGVPGSTVLGYEPIPDTRWKRDQVDAGNAHPVPWMQIVELKDLPAFADADPARPGSFVVLNDHTAGYSLGDITGYIELAHRKGYCVVVTWWVLKVAIEKAGRFDLIPPPQKKAA